MTVKQLISMVCTLLIIEKLNRYLVEKVMLTLACKSNEKLKITRKYYIGFGLVLNVQELKERVFEVFSWQVETQNRYYRSWHPVFCFARTA